MFCFFKKKSVELKSPIVGEAMELSKVPDEVFASKMLGDGLAFEPMVGSLFSPIDGEVVQVFPTKHAVGIKTKEGLELLFHIGIDTVKLEGEGFKTLVEPGDYVYEGQELVKFDINLINKSAKSAITPILITNMEMVDSVEFNYGNVSKGAVVAKINLK